jgi:tellurite resistance protein TehA-like permease
MFKRALLLGIVSGVLAGVASIVYQRVYNNSLENADFSIVTSPVALIAASTFGCVLASTGYWLLNKWLKNKTDIVFNLLFVILSFASILFIFAARLPKGVTADPSLFPGHTVPMHFFPALGWLTLKPLFIKSN